MPTCDWWRRLASGITNLYREVLYLFLQRVVFRGHMAIFGTVANPAGCAVAYRRVYLETLFDTVEPQLGDDLTNSEDIFIGLAMLNEGAPVSDEQLPVIHAYLSRHFGVE